MYHGAILIGPSKTSLVHGGGWEKLTMTLWAVPSDDMLCACSGCAMAGMLTTPAIPAQPQTVLGARKACHKGDVPCILQKLLLACRS